jgi:hypothetical protein
MVGALEQRSDARNLDDFYREASEVAWLGSNTTTKFCRGGLLDGLHVGCDGVSLRNIYLMGNV